MPLVLPHVAVAHELVDSARLGAALVVHPSGEAGPGLEEGCGAQSLSEWQLNRGRPILLWGRGLLGLEVRVVLAVAHELEGVGEAAAAVGAGAAGVGAAVPLRGGRGQAHLEAGARHQRHDSHLQVHAHAAAARVPAVPRAAHLWPPAPPVLPLPNSRRPPGSLGVRVGPRGVAVCVRSAARRGTKHAGRRVRSRSRRRPASVLFGSVRFGPGAAVSPLAEIGRAHV